MDEQWEVILSMSYEKNVFQPAMFVLRQGIIILPETNSSPLKMDGWNTILSYWGPAYFQGRNGS